MKDSTLPALEVDRIGEDLNWWALSGQRSRFSPLLQLELAMKPLPKG